ncbi:hypothetical protein ETC03_08745 [Geobacillus sp. MMMUD3]|nr:hypothetical protein [Geobacillus sp. MMMUD3]
MKEKLRSLLRRLRRRFASIDSGQLRHRTIDGAGRFFLWANDEMQDFSKRLRICMAEHVVLEAFSVKMPHGRGIFIPRVEGRSLPMELFRENAELARIFIPGWRANHCPWIFSVKIPSASVDFHPQVECRSRCPWTFSGKVQD